MARGQKKTKSQHRDELERKRDERSKKNAIKKERRAREGLEEYLEEDANFVSFSNQLQIQGLRIKQMKGDGNCLFRALADQLDGEPEVHGLHRNDTVKYMRQHRQDFEPFVDKPYNKYMDELTESGTYGGNDAIVAFARNNGVDIVIHQLNEPRWVINGSEYSRTGKVIELHLSYHNGDHYSSVRSTNDPDSGGPAWPYHNHHAAPAAEGKGAAQKGKEAKALSKKEIKQQKKQKQVNNSNSKAHNNNECASVSNGRSAEEMECVVMATTGCKDALLVSQALEENMYDIDCAVNYVLQMMSLTNELDAPSEDSDSADFPCATIDKNLNKRESAVPINNDENIEESEDRKSINDSPSGTIEMSYFDSGNSEGSLKENANKSGGMKKKENGRGSQHTEYLSSRKRKEMAKKERKKRREDTQREAARTTSEQYTQISTSRELVTDLGELRI